MFHEERCDFCGDCLERCHYLPFDKKSGSIQTPIRINEIDAACNADAPGADLSAVQAR
jgi:hypothetical protein